MLSITFILTVLIIPDQVLTLICSRYPLNTLTPKSPVDENFAISISGNPQTYIVGQQYNISLNGFNGVRFVSFILALENDNGDTSCNDNLGHFEITDSVETRYNPLCVKLIESTNTNPKTNVGVAWVAPKNSGSGCVLIRATLVQHRDVWYMDDGGLTKRICEEMTDDVAGHRLAFEKPCCACDEARYELTIEGVWSRNLHPKGFPTKGWITRFSDLVGAAHTDDYRFWEYGELATLAMKDLAEHGSLRILENEFTTKFNENKIRTIIKARGLSFPNINGQSVASVRVDPQHHLISLASKIYPSPDWIVGVTGLELCMGNCTWLEHKVINLYPWDIGTDAGPTYTSADQPQMPPDVIRSMRSNFHSDPRSPFFDTGIPMKPFAILTVKRQSLYQRMCEDLESNNLNVHRECVTHPWSPWSQCSANCGEGMQFRNRVYKQPEVAKMYNCDIMMINRQDRICIGNKCADLENNINFTQRDFISGDGIYNKNREVAECQLTMWGPWSECNNTCGEGEMIRRREYANPLALEKCQNVRFFKLNEYKKCFGNKCLGEFQNHSVSDNSYATDDFKFDKQEVRGVEVEENKVLSYFKRDNGEWNIEDKGSHEVKKYQLESNKNGNHYKHLILDDVENDNENLEVGNLNAGNGGYLEEIHQSDSVNILENEYQNLCKDLNSSFKYTPNSLRYFSVKAAATESKIPSRCFQPLQLFTCSDATITANFWFYNYCGDECMLYTADSCDQNVNKFTSLEICERICRDLNNRIFMRMKQLQACLKN